MSAPPRVRGSCCSRGTPIAPASVVVMIWAIVLTVRTGYLPTLVSPESITASAPSSTALATSDASARVGREFSIIESSIWVATMTGLAYSRHELHGALLHQRHLVERQLDAEVAAGHHDAVERVDDRLEVVDRLRLLDLGEHRAADALLVHDRVDELDVVGRAHERQRDQVDAEPQREAQVLGVLVGHAPAR